ncbi:MAG: NUDIX hydrolase [Marmoricola sp.]
MAEEIVALVDESGAVTGSAPRSVVRSQNLLHSATAVLVRDPVGRFYVHRRSETKDWAPGHWDVAAGGVIALGEDPYDAALRELAEELGITGVVLEPLGTHLYEDATTRCFEHAFSCTWAGRVIHQVEEVAEGRWMTAAELGELLADPQVAFVPDSRQLVEIMAARLGL